MIKILGNRFLLDGDFDYADVVEVLDFIQGTPIIGIDTETSGLNPRKDQLYSVQLGTADIQYVIMYPHLSQAQKSALNHAISVSKSLFIGHNLKFDYQFLKNAGCMLDKVYDTMLAHIVIHNGKTISASLDSVARHYLGITLQKEARNEFLKRSFTYTETSVKYAAKDVEHLEEIMNKQLVEIKKYNLSKVVNLESQAALAFADMENEGMYLDKEEWMDLYRKNLKKSTEKELQICEMLSMDDLFKDMFVNEYQGDLFLPPEQTKKVSINLSSAQQLLPVFKRIDPRVENTSKETLEALKGTHDIIDRISEYKQLRKLTSTYGKKMFDLLEEGKIHTSFRQILDTGRVSSSAPNMQQLPSYQEFDDSGAPVKDDWGEPVFPFRHAFMAPEGWCFVSADYASQELCVIATGSKDPVWLEALATGKDLHSVCAELVYGAIWIGAAADDCAFYTKNKQKCKCPEHKKLRDNVKAINFGLAYGMGPEKLSRSLKITLTQAEELIKSYFKTFPKIHNFLERLGKFGKLNGYIRTYAPFGRIRWFEQWQGKRTEFKILGSIERQSKNTPIQGSSADMTKLAIVLIRREIVKLGLPVKLVMTVHDQIDTVCPKEYAPVWAPRLKELMEKAAFTILNNKLLKAETQITQRWSK